MKISDKMMNSSYDEYQRCHRHSARIFKQPFHHYYRPSTNKWNVHLLIVYNCDFKFGYIRMKIGFLNSLASCRSMQNVDDNANNGMRYPQHSGYNK